MARERHTTSDLRNRLVDHVHQAWAGWLAHMLASTTPQEDGSARIPKEVVEIWQSRVNAHVDDLPMKYAEKAREEADQIIELVDRTLRPRYNEQKHVKLGYGRPTPPMKVCEPCGNPGPTPRGFQCSCGRYT